MGIKQSQPNLNSNMLNICVAILKGGWRVKLLRYLPTGTCRRGGSTKLFSGYLTMGSRHYHLRWTLYYLKWICNNQRCQVVASLPSSKQFWQEQRRWGGTTLSKMHWWRFAIFGCNFRPRILHWVLAAFLSPLANRDNVHGWVHVKIRRLLVKALAQSSSDFFHNRAPASGGAFYIWCNDYASLSLDATW